MTTLEGTWHYQSYVIRPTPSEEAAPRGAAVTARKWAMGALTVRSETSPEVSGELEFGPGATLTLKGYILPPSNSSSAILVATGEGSNDGPLKGAIYRITGAIIEADGQQSVHGSVLGVRGPDTKPTDVGGHPINTVGAFTLSR
jgi:hypothetical protein